MKLKAFVLALGLVPLSMYGFAGAVHLTTDLSADFLPGTSAQQIMPTFAAAERPLQWGFGWEVMPGRMGFGGSYQVSFSQDTLKGWWLDWYAPALYLSFHPLGTRRFLDPYLEVGMGCAGRVFLSECQLRRSTSPCTSPCSHFSQGGSLSTSTAYWSARRSPTPRTRPRFR